MIWILTSNKHCFVLNTLLLFIRFPPVTVSRHNMISRYVFYAVHDGHSKWTHQSRLHAAACDWRPVVLWPVDMHRWLHRPIQPTSQLLAVQRKEEDAEASHDSKETEHAESQRPVGEGLRLSRAHFRSLHVSSPHGIPALCRPVNGDQTER